MIAHPERTEAVLDDPQSHDELAGTRLELQVNATSLTGRHGHEPEELGWSLVEDGARATWSRPTVTARPAHRISTTHTRSPSSAWARGLSLFDGTALGVSVTQSRPASRAASTGA